MRLKDYLLQKDILQRGTEEKGQSNRFNISRDDAYVSYNCNSDIIEETHK